MNARALFRRTVVLHVLVWMILNLAIPVRSGLQAWSLIWWIVMASIFLAVVGMIDVGVVFWYVMKIRPNAIGLAVLHSFLNGTSWEVLRGLLINKQELIAELRETCQGVPGLDPKEVAKLALDQGEVVAAIKLAEQRIKEAERKERAALEEKRSAERAARRQQNLRSRQLQEYGQLIVEGSLLGISKEEMLLLLDRGVVFARQSVLERREQVEMLKEAEQLGCNSLAVSLCENGNIAECRKAIRELRRLLPRAERCGVEDLLRQIFSRASDTAEAVQKSEAMLRTAEAKRDWTEKSGALSARILKVSLAKRFDLQKRLEAIGSLQPGSRPFRIAVHDLEQELEREESKLRRCAS